MMVMTRTFVHRATISKKTTWIIYVPQLVTVFAACLCLAGVKLHAQSYVLSFSISAHTIPTATTTAM